MNRAAETRMTLTGVVYRGIVRSQRQSNARVPIWALLEDGMRYTTVADVMQAAYLWLARRERPALQTVIFDVQARGNGIRIDLSQPGAARVFSLARVQAALASDPRETDRIVIGTFDLGQALEANIGNKIALTFVDPASPWPAPWLDFGGPQL